MGLLAMPSPGLLLYSGQLVVPFTWLVMRLCLLGNQQAGFERLLGFTGVIQDIGLNKHSRKHGHVSRETDIFPDSLFSINCVCGECRPARLRA